MVRNQNNVDYSLELITYVISNAHVNVTRSVSGRKKQIKHQKEAWFKKSLFIVREWWLCFRQKGFQSNEHKVFWAMVLLAKIKNPGTKDNPNFRSILFRLLWSTQLNLNETILKGNLLPSTKNVGLSGLNI